MNGAGSLGTVIQGPVIGMVAERWGWMGVLVLMVVLSAVGALALSKAACTTPPVTPKGPASTKERELVDATSEQSQRMTTEP